MFTNWAIKKYCNKLTPKLEERYGKHNYYTASQVRATVYQCDYNPTFLPLGYMLNLADDDLAAILSEEFPDVCVSSYKKDILEKIDNRSIAPKILTQLS